MLRVDYDDLDLSNDYLVMNYDGNPFNGVAFERGENDELVSETSFIDGQKNGVSREWLSSGVLIREQWFVFDALHGVSREWYQDGSPKSDGVYELGVCIRQSDWDVNGNLINEYVIDKAEPQHATLEKLRVSDLGRMVNNLNRVKMDGDAH